MKIKLINGCSVLYSPKYEFSFCYDEFFAVFHYLSPLRYGVLSLELDVRFRNPKNRNFIKIRFLSSSKGPTVAIDTNNRTICFSDFTGERISRLLSSQRPKPKFVWVRAYFIDSLGRELKPVYKVVEVGKNGMCQSSFAPTCFRAIYRIGHPTTPTIPGTKLFAFSDIRDAFFYAGNCCRVFSALASGVSPGIWIHSQLLEKSHVIEEFRRKGPEPGVYPSTVVCDEIWLLEEKLDNPPKAARMVS